MKADDTAGCVCATLDQERGGLELRRDERRNICILVTHASDVTASASSSHARFRCAVNGRPCCKPIALLHKHGAASDSSEVLALNTHQRAGRR